MPQRHALHLFDWRYCARHYILSKKGYFAVLDERFQQKKQKTVDIFNAYLQRKALKHTRDRFRQDKNIFIMNFNIMIWILIKPSGVGVGVCFWSRSRSRSRSYPKMYRLHIPVLELCPPPPAFSSLAPHFRPGVPRLKETSRYRGTVPRIHLAISFDL